MITDDVKLSSAWKPLMHIFQLATYTWFVQNSSRRFRTLNALWKLQLDLICTCDLLLPSATSSMEQWKVTQVYPLICSYFRVSSSYFFSCFLLFFERITIFSIFLKWNLHVSIHLGHCAELMFTYMIEFETGHPKNLATHPGPFSRPARKLKSFVDTSRSDTARTALHDFVG